MKQPCHTRSINLLSLHMTKTDTYVLEPQNHLAKILDHLRDIYPARRRVRGIINERPVGLFGLARRRSTVVCLKILSRYIAEEYVAVKRDTARSSSRKKFLSHLDAFSRLKRHKQKERGMRLRAVEMSFNPALTRTRKLRYYSTDKIMLHLR